MTYPKRLNGYTFGRLTVLHEAKSWIPGRRAWWCRCTCGTEKAILRTNLISGTTTSCGCLRQEQLSHQASTHRKSHRRVYTIWKQLIHRKRHHHCNVCQEWDHFPRFYADLKDPKRNQYLCRLDPNEPYCIWNCYWGDQSERTNPHRLNKWHKYHGTWMTLPTICRLERRVDEYHKIYTRLRRGDSLQRALR